MPLIVIIGICTGVLSGVWVWSSMTWNLITFAGFLGWSTFFAAGGGEKGLKDALTTNLSGVVWGYLMVQGSAWISPALGEMVGLPLAVAVGAFAMCYQSRWQWFRFIPGAFIGSSTFFATNFNVPGSVFALVLGILFGYASERCVRVWKREPA